MPKPLSLKQQILWILIPALTYAALYLLRPWWIHPYCALNPGACSRALVNSFDQFAFIRGSVLADFCSNLVQNGTGVIAFLAPWFFHGFRKRAWQLNLALLSITACNGVFLEVVRALVQRPRPLVMDHPETNGANIHLYTSFYSGHTSFVALATLFTLLWYQNDFPENQTGRRMWLFACFLLPLLTGVLRVFGGRHYPTDILGGWVLGFAIAWRLTGYFLKRLETEAPNRTHSSPLI